MSSFPLLRLPLVALRNVTDYWNPIELYQFAKVSGKTKELAKSLSKIPQGVIVRYGLRYAIQLTYQNKDQIGKSYMLDVGLRDPLVELALRLFDHNNTDHTLTYILTPSEDPPTESIIIFGEILEIFKCSICEITLSSFNRTYEKFKDFILWINSLKQEIIPEIYLKCSDIQKLGIFFKHFEKPTEVIYIDSDHSCIKLLNKPHHFSGVEFNSINIPNANWLRLKELMAINFVEANFSSSRVTSETINTFLKSWAKGTTHERMKKCIFDKLDVICLRTILKGVSIENQEAFDYNQIEGNVKIQGNNGNVAEIVFNKDVKQFCITVL